MTLHLEGVSRRLGGRDLIADIEYTFDPGGRYVLLGPSGSGKTMLLRLLAGLERPTRGRVLVKKRNLAAIDMRERAVAALYPKPVNYPTLTVYENIASPLRVKRVPAEELDRRVTETGLALGLGDYLNHMPQDIGPALQQRCALARALVRDAELVLLDEPLQALEALARKQLRGLMQDLLDRTDATVLFATSDPAEAQSIGGTVLILEEGRLLQSGPVDEVFSGPKSLAVARIVSQPPLNLIDGRVDKGRVSLGVERLARFKLKSVSQPLADGRYHFALRARDLSLHPRGERDLEIDAEVIVAEVRGSDTILQLQLGKLIGWLLVQAGLHRLRPGSQVKLFIDPADFFVYDLNGELCQAPVPEMEYA